MLLIFHVCIVHMFAVIEEGSLRSLQEEEAGQEVVVLDEGTFFHFSY